MSFVCNNPEPISIEAVIKNVSDGIYALAPFQRDEVWSWTQQKLLLDSLLNGIPIGIFYLWELNTKQSVSASKGQKKKISVPFRSIPGLKTKENKVKFRILDGQQRLSFLTWIYNESHGISQDRNMKPIYFDVLSKNFINRSQKFDSNDKVIIEDTVKEKKVLILVQDIINTEKTLFTQELKVKKKNKEIDPKEFAEIGENIDNLKGALTSRKVVIQTLSKDATLTDAFALYKRVNQAGKKLVGTDYVEAGLFGVYPNLYELIGEKVKELSKTNQSDSAFSSFFKKDNFLKCITHYLFGTHNPQGIDREPLSLLMNFDDPRYRTTVDSPTKKLTEAKIREAFHSVSTSFTVLKKIMEDNMYFINDKGLNPTFCIPISILLKNNSTPNKETIGKIIRHFIRFHICDSPYTGGQDKKINNDINAVLYNIDYTGKKHNDPFEALDENLIKNNRNNDPKISNHSFGSWSAKLKSTRRQFLDKLLLMLAIYKGGVDWKRYEKLENINKRGEIEVHHIFPKKLFNSFPNKKILMDHILNTARILGKTNKELQATAPENINYFKAIKALNHMSLEAQQIPGWKPGDIQGEKLWKFNTKFNNGFGKNFFEARRKLLIPELNDFIKRFLDKDWDSKTQTIDKQPTFDLNDIKTANEGQHLEFKESLFTYDDNLGDKKYQSVVSKEICAFLNNGGGDLFIGVKDEPGNDRVVGLERDFNWISEKYKQQLNGANPESKFFDFFEAVLERDFGRGKTSPLQQDKKNIELELINIDQKKILHIRVRHVGKVVLKTFYKPLGKNKKTGEYIDANKKPSKKMMFKTESNVSFTRIYSISQRQSE